MNLRQRFHDWLARRHLRRALLKLLAIPDREEKARQLVMDAVRKK